MNTKKLLRVLQIEDNPLDAELVQEMLKASIETSWTFSTVQRLTDALSFFADNTVDIVLLDLGLPDSSGIDTLRRMHLTMQTVPTIVLTSSVDPQLRLDAIKAGAQDYLVKGVISLQILERVISYALERHRAKQQVKDSEQFFRATLDALSSQIAILDHDGVIITVNQAWSIFAAENNDDICVTGPGANYLKVCDKEEKYTFAAVIATGIRGVISGSLPFFHVEYPCHSPDEERWFYLRCTPFHEGGKNHVVIARENITARKKAEKAQLQSEGIFEKIFETIPLGMWLADARGRLLRANPEAIRIWGADPLIGPQEYGIFKAKREPSGEELQAQDWALNRTTTEGVSIHDEELEIEAFDGVRRTILNSSIPLKNAAGEIEGAIVTNLDITERRKAEASLAASEQRLQLVFDTSPSCLFIKDAEGRYLMANKATARLFDLAPAEMTGKTDEQLGIAGFAFDASRSSSPAAGDQQQAGNPFARTGKEEFVTHHNKQRWFRVHRSPLALDKAMTCELTLAVDISAHRTAREKLRNSELMIRTILDTLRSKVLLVNKGMQIIWANQAACQYAGKNLDEMTGRPCFEVSPGGQEGLCPQCPTVLSFTTGEYNEREVKSKDGRTWHTYAQPIRSAKGEIVSVVNVADDISRRLSLEGQLRQAQKMESLGTLAGGIAHDFNNILSGIIGFTDLALMDPEVPPTTQQYLKEVYHAGMRATDLVRQILTFSRKGGNRRQPLQVSLVIREAIKLLRSTLPTTVELKSSIQKDIGTVLADPTQIHQIIMNLCTNASHAMEPNGGVLTVTVIQDVPPPHFFTRYPNHAQGSYLQLKVSDTGSGIPEDVLPFIFDPYYTTKDLGEGTGLGLAVVHGIINDYGGGILVDSTMGAGTTFTLFLPVTAESEHDEAKRTEDEITSTASGNILVIDDEPALGRVCKGILEKAGYTVTTLSNPVEAMELFALNPQKFDLVITDLTMPKIRGDQLGQQIQAIRPELPIILMTGFNQNLTEENITALGFRALISKPFEKNVLLKSVSEILRPV